MMYVPRNLKAVRVVCMLDDGVGWGTILCVSIISINNLKCELFRPQHTFLLLVHLRSASDKRNQQYFWMLLIYSFRFAFVDAAINCVYRQQFSEVFTRLFNNVLIRITLDFNVVPPKVSNGHRHFFQPCTQKFLWIVSIV